MAVESELASEEVDGGVAVSDMVVKVLDDRWLGREGMLTKTLETGASGTSIDDQLRMEASLGAEWEPRVTEEVGGLAAAF